MNKEIYNQDYWYAIAFDNKDKSKPTPYLLFETPILLLNKHENPTILLDRCPHRNAPLSCGKLINGQLECPYHGWRFDHKGLCTQIPGLLKFQPKAHYNVKTFPTCKAAGLIWTSTGTPKHQPYIPSYTISPNYTCLSIETVTEAKPLNAIENFLDGTHTHFVHPGLIRFNHRRKKIIAEITTATNSVEINYYGEEKQQGIIAKLFEGKRIKSLARFTSPNIAELEYHDKKGIKAAFYVHFIPQTSNKTRILANIYIRNRFLPKIVIKALLMPFLRLALKQDQKILAIQQANLARFGKEAFINTELDLIRPYLKKLIENHHLRPGLKKKVHLLV